MAVVIGMMVMATIVAIAVAIFISVGSKTAPFDYLEKKVFETEYGVSGMIASRKEQFKPRHTRNNVIGAVLCILALIPLFVGISINENDDLLMIGMLSLSLLIVAVGVMYFIIAGISWTSYEKLLQEGDYSVENKKHNGLTSNLSLIYWLIVIAIYIGYSFYTYRWDVSWIILVVAGILYPVILAVTNLLPERKNEK